MLLSDLQSILLITVCPSHSQSSLITASYSSTRLIFPIKRRLYYSFSSSFPGFLNVIMLISPSRHWIITYCPPTPRVPISIVCNFPKTQPVSSITPSSSAAINCNLAGSTCLETMSRILVITTSMLISI